MEPPTPSAWFRRDVVSLVVFGLALLLSLFWTVPSFYSPRVDSAIYLACAKSLAAGDGYSFLGAPFHLRPPGLSLLLTPVVWLWGYEFFRLNLYVSLFGVAAVLGLAVLWRPRVGLALSMLLASGVWLHPEFQTLLHEVMSDVPGLAMMVGCLLLERRAGQRSGSRCRLIWLGVAVGVATLVRTLTVLLLPAFLAAWVASTQRDRNLSWRAWLAVCLRRWGWVVVAAGMILLPWSVRNALVTPTTPADQTLAYSYSTAMWHADPGDPLSPRLSWSDVVARAQRVAPQAVALLGTFSWPDGAETTIWLGVAVLLALLGSTVRHRRPEDLFALATVVATCAYFRTAQRLLLPVYVLALPALVEGLGWFDAKIGRRQAGWAIGVVVVSAYTLFIADPRPHWPSKQRQHQTRLDLGRRVQAVVSPEARLAAWEGFFFNVYFDRPVVSLHRAVIRAQGDPKAALSVLEKHDVTHVLLRQDPGQQPERALGRFLLASNPAVMDLGPWMLVTLR